MESNDKLERLLRQLYAQQPPVDVDEEWKKFEARHYPARPKARMLLKIAAGFVGFLMLSGLALAAIRMASNSGSTSATEQAYAAAAPAHAGTAQQPAAEQDSLSAQIRTFENVALDKLVDEVAQYHHKKVDISNEQARSVRLYYKWEQQEPLERVVEDLNHFEHVDITIDNETLTVR